MDQYDEAAERWARNMRAAQPFIRRRQAEAREKMIASRAAGAQRPCGIKGCKRHTYKARLCRKHYDLVPFAEKVGCQMACFNAQMRAASKWQQKYLGIAQALVNAEQP